MTAREQLAKQALALSPEDRLYVADVLEQSLTHGAFADRGAAEAWNAEITRRIEAYERGEVTALDADDGIQRMRSRLAEHRARRADAFEFIARPATTHG